MSSLGLRPGLSCEKGGLVGGGGGGFRCALTACQWASAEVLGPQLKNKAGFLVCSKLFKRECISLHREGLRVCMLPCYNVLFVGDVAQEGVQCHVFLMGLGGGGAYSFHRP